MRKQYRTNPASDQTKEIWDRWFSLASPEWQVALDAATERGGQGPYAWIYGSSETTQQEDVLPPVLLFRLVPHLGPVLARAEGRLTPATAQRALEGLAEMVVLPEPFPGTGEELAFGKYEVTQDLYAAVMGENPSHFKGDLRLPVEMVSWYDAVAFCDTLTKMVGGVVEVRLPTDAEWEFAARAGQNFAYAGSDNPDEVAWTHENSQQRTHPVGQKKPNAWGLYDMSGNVSEWTSTEQYQRQVCRGGSWITFRVVTQLATRSYNWATGRVNYTGFRICFEVPENAKSNPRRQGTSGRVRHNPAAFTIYHADHGITATQMNHIQNVLEQKAPQGFFIQQVEIPRALGAVPNALYGPDAGDAPVAERSVYYAARGGRAVQDRLVSRPVRPWNCVQAIGTRSGDTFTLYTVYGGPLAPMHPDDPNNPDAAGARRWWAQHALSDQLWKA